MRIPTLPKVSIIVPVYNGASTLASCIESLLNQTYPSNLTEIIIIDNNSIDGSDMIIESYPVQLLYERDIQTSYAARNKGINEAAGDILAFTDSDCVVSPDWIDHIVPHFLDPEVGGVIGPILNYESNSLIGKFSKSHNPIKHSKNKGLIAAVTANVAYRSALIDKLGCFDELLFTAGDVDLSYRFQIIENKKFVYENNAVVHHKTRESLYGLFQQYTRYGYSEILLATLYRHRENNHNNKKQLSIKIRNQIFALLIYSLSFLKRIILQPFKKYSQLDLYKPALLFIIELATIIGKIKALIDTRFMNKNPYPSREEIIR